MPFMKGFALGSNAGWTRRGTILGAAGMASCANAGELAGRAEPDLWSMTGPPVLRGAVIAQRRRRIAVDGPTFGGGGAVLPVYQRSDFAALAEAGANLVVMSFPEFWTVGSPWKRDAQVTDALGRQLDDARAAGLFVVLAMRSGPGRSDFVFHREAQDTWFPARLIDDSVWRNGEAQAALAAMCVDAATLVKSRQEIAGLNIMVEPDPNVGGLDRDGRPLQAWTPEDYLARVNEASDWPRIAGDVARMVRAEAPDLPILISPPAFGRTEFLAVMGAPPVSGVVWCVHDYEPRNVTHLPQNKVGSASFSAVDGEAFTQRIDRVVRGDAPIFLGEFGASRWAGNVDAYYTERIAACETRGMSWAAFRWPTLDEAYERSDAMFNVRLGDGRGGRPALDALRQGWARNSRQPRRRG